MYSDIALTMDEMLMDLWALEEYDNVTCSSNSSDWGPAIGVTLLVHQEKEISANMQDQGENNGDEEIMDCSSILSVPEHKADCEGGEIAKCTKRNNNQVRERRLKDAIGVDYCDRQ